jgi:hypothetical protein
VKLVATEVLVLVVAWLIGRLWQLEYAQAKARWSIAISLAVGALLALIAADPHGAHEPSFELICGGALGLLIMMRTHLRRMQPRD